MHIVEIPSFFPPYGGEFCLEQAKALKALGHEVRVLSNIQLSIKRSLREFICFPYGRWWDDLEDVEVYCSFQRGIPKVVKPNVKRWIGIVRSMFADYVKRYGKPDILHAHCVKWAGYVAMQLSEQYGIPYVITEHLPKQIYQVEFGEAPSNVWQIPLLKQALRQANKVITVSEELVDDLSCYFGKDYQHTTVSNMIDTDFFAYRARRPLAKRPFSFCCPAVYVERKGYDVLFAAFDKVVDAGYDVRLFVAGEGTDGTSCQRLLQTFSCASHIKCFGFLDKGRLRDMLYDSDALVLATRGESQGLVLLEALCTGIPIVSTEGIPRSVRFSKGCSFVPVNDVAALADAMINVMNTPQSVSEQIAQEVCGKVSPHVIASKMEEVFIEVTRTN